MQDTSGISGEGERGQRADGGGKESKQASVVESSLLPCSLIVRGTRAFYSPSNKTYDIQRKNILTEWIRGEKIMEQEAHHHCNNSVFYPV